VDIDPMELIEPEDDDRDKRNTTEQRKSCLNTHVAISIALLATFLGICKVKDDNIVQAMQQAQADAIDSWNFYQARNLREEVNNVAAAQLQVQKLSQSPAIQAAYTQQIAQFQKNAQQQALKKTEQQTAAKNAREKYDRLNYHDDQFDLSDALLAISISLLAVTSLVQKRWLFYGALVPTFFGVLMGCAGLFGWRIHPDSITNLLSQNLLNKSQKLIVTQSSPMHHLAKIPDPLQTVPTSNH
jgi:Domain of unknown function (DUF4337)